MPFKNNNTLQKILGRRAPIKAKRFNYLTSFNLLDKIQLGFRAYY